VRSASGSAEERFRPQDIAWKPGQTA